MLLVVHPSKGPLSDVFLVFVMVSLSLQYSDPDFYSAHH